MWRLSYPTQRVTVPGEGEITVIGDSSDFRSYQAAVRYLDRLRERWTGLKADITPVPSGEGGAPKPSLDAFARGYNPGNHDLRRRRTARV